MPFPPRPRVVGGVASVPGQDEVTPRPLPRFRLKGVDRRGHGGLFLGVVGQIVALRAGRDVSQRQPLLPVYFCNLGERVWRLDLSNWPALELNPRIDGLF